LECFAGEFPPLSKVIDDVSIDLRRSIEYVSGGGLFSVREFFKLTPTAAEKKLPDGRGKAEDPKPSFAGLGRNWPSCLRQNTTGMSGVVPEIYKLIGPERLDSNELARGQAPSWSDQAKPVVDRI